ncbi:binding-protein-dependent transport systems inner membrane component [Beutenbergia cavernae DSM 12333]|uniref:Binding-protein-dependent transport systems inner membrane component n=1 Tax=Beutenbergia cavernae (strain ATCC BAA-8 / DSM 12333 / CCUG 43141 / JCM 11478 / NBRC 16432 / NCIMB 13614 / HKI 0122) TaxID=471853 RepID=C5C399_BEUC1|nr:carbohydrate ABC transporter permease [Beutenbergia cavernae]ACQ79798.1 binding-protein-dependent transport systems inner membrane component [Beutenbergia cavernae DSM 12333]
MSAVVAGDRRRTIRRRLPWWLLAVVLLALAFVWVFPFIWMLSASLKSSAEIFAGGLGLVPETLQWENYSRAWEDGNFRVYLLNTVIVTVATVVIVVVRCALAGYVLGRYKFPGSRLVIGILVATLFVPTGYTIIPIVKLSLELGLLDQLSGMILALAGGANVASILIYAGYFRGLPQELEEAAIVDGAGFLRTFSRIMLPLSMPVTATVGILTFLFTWNAFFLPLVFSFSNPALRTVSVGMQAFVGENSTDWPGMAAAGVISLLPIVLLFAFMQRYFVEGIAGAVKS